jgi:hypothetical protein
MIFENCRRAVSLLNPAKILIVFSIHMSGTFLSLQSLIRSG